MLVALAGTAIAAYQDFRTSFIDDKIVYGMIAIGLALQLSTLNINIIGFVLAGIIVIIAIGFYLFKTGQLGMGDVLLLAGIQSLLPFAPLSTTRQLGLVTDEIVYNTAVAIPFVVNVLVVASILALVWNAIYYSFLLHKKGKFTPNMNTLLLLVIMFGVLVTATHWAVGLSAGQLAFFAVVGLASALLTSLRTAISRHILLKYVRMSEIVDEDVIAVEEMQAGIVKKYGIEKVYTPQNKEKLKKLIAKEGIRHIPVYQGLPRFGPFLLIALILAVLLANPLALVLLY